MPATAAAWSGRTPEATIAMALASFFGGMQLWPHVGHFIFHLKIQHITPLGIVNPIAIC